MREWVSISIPVIYFFATLWGGFYLFHILTPIITVWYALPLLVTLVATMLGGTAALAEILWD